MGAAGKRRAAGGKGASQNGGGGGGSTAMAAAAGVVGLALAVAVFAWQQQQQPQRGRPPAAPAAAGANGAAAAIHDALRRQDWDAATAAVRTAAADPTPQIPAQMLPMTVAAHAMASLPGAASLGGVCTGACGREGDGTADVAQHAAHAVAARAIAAEVLRRRPRGWAEHVNSALLAAVRARSLGVLRALAEVLHEAKARDPWSAADEAVMVAPPLLHLAATTRSEVTTLSRILLKRQADGPAVQRVRAQTWLRSLGDADAAQLAAQATRTLDVQKIRETINLWTVAFVKPLLDLGCDAAAEDDQGENALHVAALYGNTAAAAAMLEGRGDAAVLLGSKARSGHSAPELAAIRGRVRTACYLLAAEAGGEHGVDRFASYLAVYGVHYADCRRVLDGTTLPTRQFPWKGVAQPMAEEELAVPQLHPSLVASVMRTCGTHVKPVAVVASADMNPQRFFFEYYMAGHPVVIRGGAADWRMRAEWAPERLKSVHGELPVVPEQLPYGTSFGEGEVRAGTLGAYVRAWDDPFPTTNGTYGTDEAVRGGRNYVFQHGDPTVAKLMEAARVPGMPPLLRPAGDRSPFRAKPPQFYAGAAGTGAPVHIHGDAWNALAHGRKRWVLFPPEQARYSTVPAAEFYARELPDLCAGCGAEGAAHCPVQFTQEAGDIVFVPREWGHAVLNVQPSVGVAAEFDSRWSRSGDDV